MSSQNQSLEQRSCIRYRLKENIFVAIQGHPFEGPASVADLSRNGVGFFSACERGELVDKFIKLDLISARDQVILRYLSAHVVFSCKVTPHEKDTAEVARRYGLKFLNLSDLQKRQLGLITKKYALPE